MGDSNKLSTSDDEEDLEALRLAALQSLKKRNAALNGAAQSQSSSHLNPEKPIRYNRAMKGMQNKRGRFFGPHPGRNGKIGQFNNRVRNTNLISIPTIPSEDEKIEEKMANNSLTLPQDRYCGVDRKDENTGEGSSKFNRYNNSDKSETESEEEDEASSEDDSPGKLEKSDSLEALMQELDAEIQGKTKVKEEKPVKEEKSKSKKTKKKKPVVSETVCTSDSDIKTGEQKVEKVESDNNVEVIKHNEKSNSESENKEPPKVEIKLKDEPVPNRHRFDDNYRPATKRPRSRSPINRRGFMNRRRQRNFQKFPNQLIPNIPFVPPPTQYPPPVLPFPNQPFNPIFGPPNINMMNQPPPFFERPISPLAINTESLTTATLAPLSPRSAAFVLENKAIIERRKRSPRRSYSRSPSCSPRRSLTPRRSPRRSPPRRSISPRRKSRSPRRLSRSPRRRSLSPRRRSLSPRRRNIGKSTDNSPKHRAPVRARLGLKSNKTEESKEKTKEPESSPPNKDEKPLDPILEARKKKFESNEIKMKEGIIRLKPKEEKPKKCTTPAPVPAPVPPPVLASEEKPCQIEVEDSKEPDAFEELENLLNDSTLLAGEDIELDAKVDDLFSDEDSASDNEGRFKVKQQIGEKPLVLPFTKLVNGGEIKSEAIPDSLRNGRDRRDRRERRNNRYDKKRTRAHTPDRKDVIKENIKEEDDKRSTPKKNESQEKSPVKNRISLKNDRHVTPMEKKFERKIEIKIKNPSKYERGGKLKFSKESEEKVPEKVKRKVEVGIKDEVMEEDEDEVEPEIVVENDSGDENSIINEGDLRAQLSKKRAEKLHRIPVDGVSSRLLQNALQGAVFKKTKKKVKEQDITSSDGKLPIHLRLGIAKNSDIFADTKAKRKSRKRKNREVLEQVYYLLLRHYYISQF